MRHQKSARDVATHGEGAKTRVVALAADPDGGWRHSAGAPAAQVRAAADGRNVNLDEVLNSGRDGVTGQRKQGDIGFAVMRGGDVAGEHTATFFGQQERIELTHRAGSRAIFARGALNAAAFASAQIPGLYSMDDVLG